MEINFAFYPPPTINLPNLEIPGLKEYKVFKYEYFEIIFSTNSIVKGLLLKNMNKNNKFI